MHALWSECGWLPEAPPARALGPPLSCPVLSCLAVSSLGHFTRRLEEREFREQGAENLKINETPNHLPFERVFFFFFLLPDGRRGTTVSCRIVIYKCSSDEGFSNSRLGRLLPSAGGTCLLPSVEGRGRRGWVLQNPQLPVGQVSRRAEP